jgi:hypothetical protein
LLSLLQVLGSFTEAVNHKIIYCISKKIFCSPSVAEVVVVAAAVVVVVVVVVVTIVKT